MTRIKLRAAPLPRPVRPFQGELLSSYLRRLSHANRLGILQAHKKHLRLVRRFGRDETMIKFASADYICQQWREYRQHDEEFRRRMRIFHGSSWEVPAAHPTIAAAAYPQVVALTRLLITPHWKNLAIEFWHAEHPVFVRELHQTVAPGLRWPQPSFSKDPLHRWLIGGHRRTAFDLVTV